jgi:hypothetical protein
MKHRLLFREEKKFSIGLSENFLLSIGLSEIGLLFQKFFRERGDPPEVKHEKMRTICNYTTEYRGIYHRLFSSRK